MAKRILTLYEEHRFLEYVVKKYSRDETILALKRKLSEMSVENNSLKQQLESSKKKTNSNLQQITERQRLEIGKIYEMLFELQYVIMANNVPCPKRLLLTKQEIKKSIKRLTDKTQKS